MTDSVTPSTGVTEYDGRERATAYGRVSSDGQSRASIPDQLRNCREAATEKEWAFIEECVRWDQDQTGTSLVNRKGIQDLIAMAKLKPRPFDIIIIDDTSRFGRNMGDVFKMLDIFDFYGVRLYFVSEEMISGTDTFREVFTNKARADEQFSKTHGKRVRRGRIGRFEAGFNPGGGCYGYRNEKVYDPTRKGEHGELGIEGRKQVKAPEEAKIVLRIWESYSAGKSYKQIAVMLNEESVPPPQSTRKHLQPSWSKHAIQTILANDRYRGKLVYGKTKEKRDPETGKRIREAVPANQWKHREDPELRIISEELYERVEQRRKLLGQTYGVERSGGMNRTKRSRQYLLSGPLCCGACMNPMTIRTTNPARYQCSAYADRNGCTNRASVSQEKLEQVFLHALSEQVRAPGLAEDLIHMLEEHLRETKSRHIAASLSAEEQRSDLEATRRRQIQYQQNLVTAVRESGGSRALYEDLARVEARIARIDEMLAETAREPMAEIPPDEIRKYVMERLQTLEGFLAGNSEALRNEFQRRISRVILTPATDEQGPVYRVTGDVDLFADPNGVLQTQQGPLMGLQYKIPVSCEIRLRAWTAKRPQAIAPMAIVADQSACMTTEAPISA